MQCRRYTCRWAPNARNTNMQLPRGSARMWRQVSTGQRAALAAAHSRARHTTQQDAVHAPLPRSSRTGQHEQHYLCYMPSSSSV